MNRRVSVMVGLLAVPALVASSAVGVAGDTSRGMVAAPARASVVSVAGDIACGTSIAEYNKGAGTRTECRQRYTARLLRGTDAVWTLGDHAYPTATTRQFKAAYGPTWGRLKAVTYPTPGDHDYGKTDGRDYFSYFGKRPYYAFRMAGWLVFSLNSEIDHSPTSPQVRWLQAILASARRNCIAAYWSLPRWTSGTKAPGDASFTPFWRALYGARADLVLGADTHNYERYAPQTPSGALAADGIREFVVGTGGRSLVTFPKVQPNSRVRRQSFGVLKLTLRTNTYAWRFVNEARAVLDSGFKRCN